MVFFFHQCVTTANVACEVIRRLGGVIARQGRPPDIDHAAVRPSEGWKRREKKERRKNSVAERERPSPRSLETTAPSCTRFHCLDILPHFAKSNYWQ